MKDNNISQLRNLIVLKMSRTTQSKIAEKLGISQSYLNLMIHGHRTPKNITEYLKKINKVLSNGFSKN